MRELAFPLCLLLLLTGFACGKKKKQVRSPVAASAARTGRSNSSNAASRSGVPVPVGYTETGVASWYGHPYHGRQAADGEIYDMETLVAAHRTLPFQTMVCVTMLETGRFVDVRIIDRGPFVDGRIIDLSHAAAKEIGLIGPGVGQVSAVVIRTPDRPEPAIFGVQVGLFREETNADRLTIKMGEIYGSAKKVARAGSPPTWRVIAGRALSQSEADDLAKRIRLEQNVPEAFVVRLDQ